MGTLRHEKLDVESDEPSSMVDRALNEATAS